MAPSADDRVLSVACCCRFCWVAAPAPGARPPLACNLNAPVPLLRLMPPTRQQHSNGAGVQPAGALALPTAQGAAEEVTRLVPPPVLALAGVEMKDSAVEMSAMKVLAAVAAQFFIFPSTPGHPQHELALALCSRCCCGEGACRQKCMITGGTCCRVAPSDFISVFRGAPTTMRHAVVFFSATILSPKLTMRLRASWGVHHALALGLAFHCPPGEGFGVIPSASRRSQRTVLASSKSPLPPPGYCAIDAPLLI